MKVMKFGGSSVADADRIRAVAGLVRESARDGRVVVVLSALKGVTDLLVAAARAAEAGSDDFRTALDTLRARHLEAVRGLFAPADQASVITPLTLMANELEEILHGVELLRECTHRTMDLAMSFGERMSCAIFTALLASLGERAVYVDARELIVTDERFGSGVVDFAASYPRIASRLGAEPGIPVVPGFIAATPKGVTTTLGRNGSDYTASIVGAGLGAETIEIWTDVDGVLSADPRVVPGAFVIPRVTFEEAMELSYFGAKVIHPSTMIPAVEKRIPIVIRNTLNPSAPGTLIGNGGRAVRAPDHGHRLDRGHLAAEHRGRRHDRHPRHRRAHLLRPRPRGRQHHHDLPGLVRAHDLPGVQGRRGGPGPRRAPPRARARAGDRAPRGARARARPGRHLRDRREHARHARHRGPDLQRPRRRPRERAGDRAGLLGAEHLVRRGGRAARRRGPHDPRRVPRVRARPR